MAYNETPTRVWDRDTPRDGLLLQAEFARIYDAIANYIVANGGSAPPYTLKQLADGTISFTGAKTFSGSLTVSGSLILPAATTPAQTAEGSVVWDSDNDLLTVGDGTSRKTMVDTSQNQTIAGVKTFSSTIVGSIDSIKETGSGTYTVRKKIFDLGAWNLQSSSSKQFTHGLTFSKIISISGYIHNDDGTGGYPFGYPESSNYIFATKQASTFTVFVSGFNYPEYSSTGVSRGWAHVEYID